MQNFEDHLRSSKNDSRTSDRDLDDEFSHLTVEPPAMSEEARRALAEDGAGYARDHGAHRVSSSGPSTPMIWGVLAAATILVTTLRTGDHSHSAPTMPHPSHPERAETQKPSRAAPTAPATKRADSREEMKKLSYNEYAALIKEAGGKLHPDGMPSVLAIRFQTHIKPAYDDLIVVLTADKKVTVLDGATHPSVHSLPNFMRDVNGDGLHDVGMIRPGNYVGVPNGKWLGDWSFRLLTTSGREDLPGWRNTKRDGDYSREEIRASERRGDTVDGILIHRGHEKGAFSVGCNTLSPDNLKKFVSAVGGENAKFTYTLIDRTRK